MKQSLSRDHRKILETTVAQARVAAETGAEKTLKALAVAVKDAPAHASDAQKKLRVSLRAHGRALGDLLALGRPPTTSPLRVTPTFGLLSPGGSGHLGARLPTTSSGGSGRR